MKHSRDKAGRFFLRARLIALLRSALRMHAGYKHVAPSERRLSLGETAETVEFMGADCVIVTGSATGKAPSIADVREAKTHCGLPVLIGSGITVQNVGEFYDEADGFIIGTHFKVDGVWSNTVDGERVKQFMRSFD